jgi:hypothetical protein
LPFLSYFSNCEFLLLQLSLLLLVSLLHIAGFSTVADFPTDTGGPADFDIHDALLPLLLLMFMVLLL